MLSAVAAHQHLAKDVVAETDKASKDMTCPSCQAVHQAKVRFFFPFSVEVYFGSCCKRAMCGAFAVSVVVKRARLARQSTWWDKLLDLFASNAKKTSCTMSIKW